MTVRQEMVSGVFWGIVQKYSGIVVQLVITGVLARLLSPETFGIVAVATVLIHFFTLFTNMGIGPAIVQHQSLSDEDLRSIFSLSIYGGTVVALLFFALAKPIAAFWQNEQLVGICRILSIQLLFAAWNMVPNALVNKNKRFRFVAERTLAMQIVSGAAAVAAAYGGWSIYALLIPPVFTAVGVFFLNYRKYPLRFHRRAEFSAFQKIWSFSVYQFLFNIVNYFSRNMDKLIVGRWLGMSELGYYEKSYRLMMMPVNNITFVLTPVMLPVLSPLQNDRRALAEKYDKIVHPLAAVSFPLSILLYFVADDLIAIVFGGGWARAVPPFQILALSLPAQMLWASNGPIYQAAGRADWLFYRGLSNFFCTAIGFVVATVIFGSIEAMAWAWDITITLNTIISFVLLYRGILHQSMRILLHISAEGMAVATGVGAALWMTQELTNDLPPLLSVLLLMAAAAVITLPYYWAIGLLDFRHFKL